MFRCRKWVHRTSQWTKVYFAKYIFYHWLSRKHNLVLFSSDDDRLTRSLTRTMHLDKNASLVCTQGPFWIAACNSNTSCVNWTLSNESFASYITRYFFVVVCRCASDKYCHTGQAAGFTKIRESRDLGYLRCLLDTGDSDGVRRGYLSVYIDGLEHRLLGDLTDRGRRSRRDLLVLRLQ